MSVSVKLFFNEQLGDKVVLGGLYGIYLYTDGLIIELSEGEKRVGQWWFEVCFRVV